MERFGDIWRGELDDDFLLPLRIVLGVSKTEARVLSEGIVVVDDCWDRELNNAGWLEEELQVRTASYGSFY